MEKFATRKDIAIKAQTSVSVVSRALNNSGYVAKEKKEKILKIAEELNYVPNPVALSLQNRRTKQILFYCKNVDNPFNIQLYKGMLETASERGYMVLFNGMISFEEIKNTLVDGIIMQDRSLATYYLESYGKNYHLPVVSASYSEGTTKGHSLPIVDVDMHKVTETALQYLWKMGHRRIALGTPHAGSYQGARNIAWYSWMQERGMENAAELLIAVSRQDERLKEDERLLAFREETAENPWIVSEDHFGKGVLAAQIFTERRLEATAVLCFNDEFALGMIRGFERLGVRVPEDISVMGIDGIHSRKYVSPLLTTVSLLPQKQGAKCAEVLLNMIEGKKYKYVNHSGFSLIEADSVKRMER